MCCRIPSHLVFHHLVCARALLGGALSASSNPFWCRPFCLHSTVETLTTVCWDMRLQISMSSPTFSSVFSPAFSPTSSDTSTPRFETMPMKARSPCGVQAPDASHSRIHVLGEGSVCGFECLCCCGCTCKGRVGWRVARHASLSRTAKPSTVLVWSVCCIVLVVWHVDHAMLRRADNFVFERRPNCFLRGAGSGCRCASEERSASARYKNKSLQGREGTRAQDPKGTKARGSTVPRIVQEILALLTSVRFRVGSHHLRRSAARK